MAQMTKDETAWVDEGWGGVAPTRASSVAGKARIDETGKKYGQLTVLEQSQTDSNGSARWRCQCDCGATIVVRGQKLRNGTVTSCGFCEHGPRLVNPPLKAAIEPARAQVPTRAHQPPKSSLLEQAGFGASGKGLSWLERLAALRAED